MLTVKRDEAKIFGMVRARSEQPDATVAFAVAGFLGSCRSANTQAAYRTDLTHLAAWCRGHEMLDLLTVDAADIARYRTECEIAGASPATVARRLSAIASFSEYNAKHGTADTALTASDIDRPSLASTSSAELLDDQTAEALLAAADQAGPRAAVAIRLLMLDGLKVGEVVRADAGDVRGRPPDITLELRTNRTRHINLRPETSAAIGRYLGRRRDGPLLLSERRGRPRERLTRFGIDYLVKQVARSAGLGQAISGNTLRRRYVSAAHAGGTDIDTIRHNTGHTDRRTTRRYLSPRGNTRAR
jgi:site-specific recombinase XerD